ncbi:MAG: hypothetical protein MUF18_02875 [Fimbriiglobus sp.]|nr:hypothetical protein [Fimbriiglobus sp.]
MTDRDSIKTKMTFDILEFTINHVSVNVAPAKVLVAATAFDASGVINPNSDLWTMASADGGKSFTVKKA